MQSIHASRAARSFPLWLAIVTASAGVTLFAQGNRGQDGGHAWSRRVVHRFDFDERPSGNLEALPRYWTPLRPAGFPRFAGGRFDEQVGRAAPPSFHLSSAGRNVAFQYHGPETRIRANTDYRVEGFIRADQLVYARACLAAHFVDRAGQPLLDTLVRSDFLGGSGESRDWDRVELFMPPAPLEAHTIALTAWVIQEALWNPHPAHAHDIPFRDVHGGAWFDDISVYALPRAELGTSSPGNVLESGDRQALHVLLADDEDASLMGRLTLRDADGDIVESRSIPVAVDAPVRPAEVPVGHLPFGLYRASLDVFAGRELILTRELRFARVAPSHREHISGARAFGVALDPTPPEAMSAVVELLRRHKARSVKWPVWTGAAVAPSEATRRIQDGALQSLLREGFALTGVFAGAPPSLVRPEIPRTQRLIEVLADVPEGWREALASAVAPYASVFRMWQVGSDADPLDPGDERLKQASAHLHDAMRTFMTSPLVAATVAANVGVDVDEWPFGLACVAVEPGVDPGVFPEQFAAWRRGRGRVSAYAPPLAEGAYHREPRLAEWAKRILFARHAGASTVYVPQPWHVRETGHGFVTEPDETWIVLRTLADVVGDGEPLQGFAISATARALAFDRGDSLVLALWDDGAPPSGRDHHLTLGPAVRRISLWGQMETLERDGQGRQIVSLTPTPVLIDGVSRWLIDLATSAIVSPDQVESGRRLMRHSLQLTNTAPHTLMGRLVMVGPPSWELSPAQIEIHIPPQRSQSFDLDIKYPHNTAAGTKSLIGQLTMADGLYVELTLPIAIGLAEVDVSGMAVVEGDRLRLRHIVTNRTSSVLHFRGAAIVPGRERQYRPIHGLAPGDTQVVEYHVDRGRALIGSAVRLELRESNDGSRTHALELVVP